MTSSLQTKNSEAIARQDFYSDLQKIDHESTFYSYFNNSSVMQLFAPSYLNPVMASWPFQSSFFSNWSIPASTPSYQEFNIGNDSATRDESRQFSYSPCSRSNSPDSPMKDRLKEPITNGKKKFECKICNKSFGYKHVLQNHEKVHTGEKNYRCAKCNKTFRRDHHLKVHMRLHSGEKPFSCSFPNCDRHFVQVANLRRHLKTHDHSENLKILKTTSSNNEQNLQFTDLLEINKEIDLCTPLDMSCKTKYFVPIQTEPEDLSKKSSKAEKERSARGNYVN